MRPTTVKPTLEFRRCTESARLADLYLQLHPGTNVALLNGVGRMMSMEGFSTPPSFKPEHKDLTTGVRPLSRLPSR